MLIGDNYKIESDSLNVTLFQKRINQKTGNPRWESIAFFSNPGNALKYIVDLEVMDTGMADLETVVKKIDELKRMINKLQGLPEVRRKSTEGFSRTCRRANTRCGYTSSIGTVRP